MTVVSLPMLTLWLIGVWRLESTLNSGKGSKRVGQMTAKWEVLDSYGITQFTGTLTDCGTWIDPVCSIVFPGHKNRHWPSMPDDIDEGRVTQNEDGSFTVEMYSFAGGSGGQLTVRKVST